MDHRIYEVRMLRRNIMELSFFTGEVKEYDIKRLLAYDDRIAAKMEHAIAKEPVISADNKKLRFSVLAEGTEQDYVIGCDDLFSQGVLVEHRKIDNVKLDMAARLVAIRENMNMTQKMLGAESGINQADISRIERGIGNPSLETIMRLAAALNKKVVIDFVDDVKPGKGDGYTGAAASYLPPYKCQGQYTYRDIMYIPMKYKLELMDGVIVDARSHDFFYKDVISALHSMISEYMRENMSSGKLLGQGVGFRETSASDCKLFVIPDIAVVCDRGRIGEEASIVGGPDFAFDIVLEDDRSAYFDRLGVREYWVMNPEKKVLTVYERTQGFDKPVVYDEEAIVPVNIFDGALNINLKGLWRFLNK